MSKKSWWIIGLIIALAVTLLSPLASPWPDGLERVAEDQGFIALAQGSLYEVIPDYVLPLVANEAVATILGGMIGVLVVFGLTVGAGYMISRRGAEQKTS